MNAPLTLHPETSVGHLAGTLFASLPVSYSPATDPATADVLAIAGDAGWAPRAADHLAAGARKLIVLDPRPEDLEQLRSLAERATAVNATVLLSETYAGNPAVESIAGQLAEAGTVVLQGTSDAPVASVLFDQLRLVRALGITGLQLSDALDNGPSALVTLRGTLHDKSVLVRLLASSTTAGLSRQVVRGYGFATAVTATLFDSEAARPATISSSGPDSGTVAPTLYETAHRATWRAMRSATASSDLDGFIEDVALLPIHS